MAEREHRWSRDEAAKVDWPPFADPPPYPHPPREFSKPINALLGNSYRWGISNFEWNVQLAQWAIEQLYDAGYVLVGPAPAAQGGGDRG